MSIILELMFTRWHRFRCWYWWCCSDCSTGTKRVESASSTLILGFALICFLLSDLAWTGKDYRPICFKHCCSLSWTSLAGIAEPSAGTMVQWMRLFFVQLRGSLSPAVRTGSWRCDCWDKNIEFQSSPRCGRLRTGRRMSRTLRWDGCSWCSKKVANAHHPHLD